MIPRHVDLTEIRRGPMTSRLPHKFADVNRQLEAGRAARRVESAKRSFNSKRARSRRSADAS